MATSITKTLSVTVNTDGSVPVTLLDRAYGIVGPVCLDAKIAKQPATQTDAAFAARVDAFASPADYTKTYRFIHNDAYSNLNLILLDPAGLVESLTSPASDGTDADKEETFTLTFKSDIKTHVPSNGDSLTVKLIATYMNNTGSPRVAYLEIRVEDGTCICPAKTGATQWLNFMCHNLGGIDIISPSQLITYEHHGDWYRFGAKNYSLKNEGTNNSSQNWTAGNSTATPPYYSSQTGYLGSDTWDWPDALTDHETVIANPCPAGWRLPTRGEWENVRDNNTPADVPVSWLSASNQTFCNLKKLGDDLILPATGQRTDTSGSLSNRGSGGYYWSSTGSSGTASWYLSLYSGGREVYSANRSYGLSVRCVEK
jgi:uncharacterized protein (TIGR02145 family)